jgi:hypothetical protein
MNRFLIFILSITLIISCKKKVTNEHKEFVGYWDCKYADGGGKGIYIASSGSGYTYELKDDKPYNIPDSRTWYIRNDKLIWRPIFGNSYTIDIYPKEADTQINFLHDTIRVGQTYMKLDGSFYIKRIY